MTHSFIHSLHFSPSNNSCEAKIAIKFNLIRIIMKHVFIGKNGNEHCHNFQRDAPLIPDAIYSIITFCLNFLPFRRSLSINTYKKCKMGMKFVCVLNKKLFRLYDLAVNFFILSKYHSNINCFR